MDEQELDLATLLQKLDDLSGRVIALERRVNELEAINLPQIEQDIPRSSQAPRPFTTIAPSPPVGNDDLIVAMTQAFEQLGGEADSGTIRTHLAKAGMISVTRSDVNKALYAHKELFAIVRQDAMKPIWKRVTE